MGQIYNRSQHPVEVKRISVRLWALRDEIEAALYRRIQECETTGQPLNIDDIKEFYGLQTDRPLSGQPQLKLVSESADDAVDSLVESLDGEAPSEEAPAEAKPEGAGEGEGQADSIEAADKIIEEQKQVTPATSETGAVMKNPYQRQAPDSDKISYGFALLSDLNMDWMLTFTKQSFVRGQSVVVEFLIPRPFMMSAEVMVCNHYAMRSRIISESKPDFRLQCRFTYVLPGERSRLREFLSTIEPKVPGPRARPAKKDEDTGPLP